MKTFEEQNYPCTIEVKVFFGGNDYMIDEIKGLNKGHAFHRALWNWESAVSIKYVRTIEGGK